MPKIKDSQVIFCNMPKVHKDRHVIELRTVDICRKIKSFFPLCPLSMLLIIDNCRKVRALGKSMVVFRLFAKLGYSNERSTKFESLPRIDSFPSI